MEILESLEYLIDDELIVDVLKDALAA